MAAWVGRTAGAVLLGLVALGCGDSGGTRCAFDIDCPALQICRSGRCVDGTCPRFPCAPDSVCVNEKCYPTDCETKKCPGKGEVCLREDCLPSSCLNVLCPPDQSCAGGRCYPTDCPGQLCDFEGLGRVCVDGQCRQRNCVDTVCPEQQRCAWGFCYPADCSGLVCRPDEVCVQEACVETICVGVSCGQDELCAAGQCWAIECQGTPCPDGQVCEDDRCVDGACVLDRCACQGQAACEPGQVCLPSGCCTLAQASEMSCGNGLDDDCDEAVDCLDADCDQMACDDGDPGTDGDACSAGLCSGTPAGCAPVGSSESCGRCDSGQRTCQADGTWSGCTGEQGCQPGTTRDCPQCGTQTCSDGCSWGDCHDQGICSPGDVWPCGDCGTMTCSDNCDFPVCNCGGAGDCTVEESGSGATCPLECGGVCRRFCMGSQDCVRGPVYECDYDPGTCHRTGSCYPWEC